MPRVLIIGAGATGALCAHILKRDLQRKIELVVWDKGRGAGGRMSTSRNPDNPRCTADLGAQYITVTPTYAEKHKKYHDELILDGVLKPFTGTIDGAKEDCPSTQHYVMPDGSSSIIKHFLKKSGAKVEYERLLTRLDAINHHESSKEEIPSVKHFLASQPEGPAVTPAMPETGVRVKIAANYQQEPAGEDKPELFDAVVLTMPAGQILQLQGLVQELLAKESHVKSRLQSVQYSCRYALGLFYDPGTVLDLPWCAHYVQGDPCIRWISVDAKKRGIDSSSLGPSLVVHTSVPFGIQYLDTNKEEVQPIIMQHLRQLLPSLPEPAQVKCQRWRYSQVSKPYEGAPGCVFLAHLPTYSLVAAGDAFTHSNLDGCISSAETTCKQLVEYLTETSRL